MPASSALAMPASSAFATADSTKSRQIRRNLGRFDEIVADLTKSGQIRHYLGRFDEIVADATYVFPSDVAAHF